MAPPEAHPLLAAKKALRKVKTDDPQPAPLRLGAVHAQFQAKAIAAYSAAAVNTGVLADGCGKETVVIFRDINGVLRRTFSRVGLHEWDSHCISALRHVTGSILYLVVPQVFSRMRAPTARARALLRHCCPQHTRMRAHARPTAPQMTPPSRCH